MDPIWFIVWCRKTKPMWHNYNVSKNNRYISFGDNCALTKNEYIALNLHRLLIILGRIGLCIFFMNSKWRNTLEVQIDKDYTMLVDFDDCFQTVRPKAGKQQHNTTRRLLSKEPAKTKRMEKRSFSPETNHINRNTMDNRTKKVNNNNRSCVCSGMFLGFFIERVPGVRLVQEITWQARIKQDNKEHGVQLTRRVVWQWKHAKTFQNNSIV